MPERNVFIDENKSSIIKDYKNGLSLHEVSKKYNSSYSAIRTRLETWGIERHNTNYRNTLNITKQLLKDLHINKKISYKDIAKLLNVSYISVIKYAKKYKLPLTSRAKMWSRKYDKCRSCGTTKLSHYKQGYCINCARKLGLITYKWPKKYPNGCILCGTTKAAYKKDGLCVNCWNKEFYKNSKLKRKNKYTWSIKYPCCVICGTTKYKHVSNGVCAKCLSRVNNKVNFKVCPVCGEKYVQIFRHWGQEIIKNKDKKHAEYLKDIFKKWFDSNFSLTEISNKIQTSRHNVTKWFNYFFGKKETEKRNEQVRCFLISSKTASNFPYGPKVQHPEYIDILGRKFKFRSKLEYVFAVWLDKNRILWEYEKYTFPYDAIDGKIRHYTPDFYLPESDFFIELKGRKFDNTVYKIKQTEKQNNIKVYTLWQNQVMCAKVTKNLF